MRKTPFINGEFYHVYNRGTDHRNIFSDHYDLKRFLQSMDIFNAVEPIGSIFEHSFGGWTAKSKKKSGKLVEFVSYCLNPNHYHFILEQALDGGISEFMKRLGGGYTWYFNHKHQRSGSLFQGKFKAVHIGTNEYLLHLSTYVNLNYRVHQQLGGPTAKLSKSSWEEYTGSEENFCKKDIILAQFKSMAEYRDFAGGSLQNILERKQREKEIKELLLE